MPRATVPVPSLSASLSGISKALLRRLDAGDIMQEALIATGHPNVNGPVIAWMALQKYAGAARRQLGRVRRANRGFGGQVGTSTTNLFDDVHFYVVSWARIRMFARFISRHTRFRQVGLVLRKYHDELESWLHLRNHLEHLE